MILLFISVSTLFTSDLLSQRDGLSVSVLLTTIVNVPESQSMIFCAVSSDFQPQVFLKSIMEVWLTG